ncbi:hypothetical protein LSH36_174g01076 [Paralvinella palmiformis]|uniref:Tetratricopeptide repeat protein 38 n=1 Tax=Paralvinella palmiformis TaxID=53620 RepID=A0AAD9JSL1_9ANNE|nr:hypothetical protein LSH36_174g01076 [Paralvinella palmiformis]
MAQHSNWRDCKAWKDAGLPFTTTSNQACKLFDAALTQYVGWYDEPSVGGLEKTLHDLLEADPENVMGHVINNGLELMSTGHSPRLDPEFEKSLGLMSHLVADTNKLSEWERQHVRAINLYGKGYMTDACSVWEDILLEYPQDMLALKFAHDSYFYLGYQVQMRDSVARVMPQWKADMPLYSYLYGMHAFGLCETNFYDEAEKLARKGEHQAAVDIFDSEVCKRFQCSGSMLDMVDACSLLFRLELEGIEIGQRWENLYEMCYSHINDHLLAFNDAHLMMAYIGAKKKEAAATCLTSLREYAEKCLGTNRTITKDVGIRMCEALVAYDDDRYADAVDVLHPVRYKLVKIGGSNAQRDIFNQFLIHAALKSEKTVHHKLARSLLAERKSLKEQSPLTDRLIAKSLLQHID